MEIKLVAVDLDGTLMMGDHLGISNRNIEALYNAFKLNTEIVIASGRPLGFCNDVVSKLPFIRYGVFSNGSFVYDLKENKVLNKISFSNDELIHIVNVLKKHKLSVKVCSDKDVYREAGVRLENFTAPSGFYEKLDNDCLKVDNLMEKILELDVQKIDIMGITRSLKEQIKSELKGKENIMITSSLHENLELTPKFANKGVGLKFLAKHLNIDRDNIMAFGDNDNDYEMISFAKWSVAMENGLEPLKKSAKIIAPSNVDDGVAVILEKYLLNK